MNERENHLLHERLLAWYAVAGRALPWREPECTPWGVFVSEIMAQQTPVARVVEPWREWMRRWPTPTALAAESPGEVVRAWGRLGYPRRALRMRDAAGAMVQRHGGEVPSDQTDLLALPGVGAYTAAAVAAFAFGEHSVVIDTNVRRVLTRLISGRAQAAPSLTAQEARLAADVVPTDRELAAIWNVAVMELGALVCTARVARCEACPVSAQCAWLAAGKPAYDGPSRRSQKYAGTDRKLRGDILQFLRDEGVVPAAAIERLDPDAARVDRLLGALIDEGFIEHDEGGSGADLPRYRLTV